jgi:predicted DNA-binding transcriptional regulator AlpA
MEICALSDNSSQCRRNHTSWVEAVMTCDSTGSRVTRPSTVTVSKWVNERLPPWSELLTSHEAARLTRRHRWTLSAVVLLGCFPKKVQFQGRKLGWLRGDVECWLGRNHRRSAELRECGKFRCSGRRTRQPCALRVAPPRRPLLNDHVDEAGHPSLQGKPCGSATNGIARNCE